MSSCPGRELSANLDLLRAVAVLLVFFSHVYRAHHDYSFASLGIFGVVLFFIHTSFVLMASLHRLESSARSSVQLALAFWTRRFFRIYPLAILCIILVIAFRIPVNPGEAYNWIGMKGILSNLALIQNLTNCDDLQGVLWSLPVEVQMYIILPFAYFALRGDNRYRSLALWALALLLAFAAMPLALHYSLMSFRRNVFIFAPCFTAGIVAFDLTRNKTYKRRLPAWMWPVCIFTAIALFGPRSGANFLFLLLRAWGLSLFLAFLFANVKEGQPNWMHNIFHWIAEHSYGIYLSHSIVLWIVFYQMAQFSLWVQIPALIAGAIGIPALLYVSIEKPLILAGGHLARRLLSQDVG